MFVEVSDGSLNYVVFEERRERLCPFGDVFPGFEEL